MVDFNTFSQIIRLFNTSFNLHGDAIIENGNQAINTFIKSNLDILIIMRSAEE